MIFGNPVRGTIRPPGSVAVKGSFRVTQKWGPTKLTVEPTVIWPGGEGVSKATYPDFHQGLDLGNSLCGSDVLAAAAGTVIYSAISSSGSQTIKIDHGSGFITWYAHLKDRKVAKGAKVTKGQLIGHVGNTGNAIGCHLHFAIEDRNFPGTVVAIRDGAKSYQKFVDPWPRLEQNVTVRPTSDPTGVYLRTSPQLAASTRYAQTKPDGRIHRLADDADCGFTATWRKWGGVVAGAQYTVLGVTDNKWDRIELDQPGVFLYLASPLAQRSHS